MLPGMQVISDRRYLKRHISKNMGILALKAMAKGPWPKGFENKEYPKCWYEPLTTY